MTYLSLYELLNHNSNVSAPAKLNYLNSNSVNTSSLLQYTIPDGKLFYPEPFIASPSYLHSDITYLHIFQYWYWLWFMFIFLICFFFISFLCTIRWCTNRIRPRRETRGVSRSKCGDLITACVPVSWAMSIIVNESTDATDLNDGFGTAELVVGVRAYQWGWEYYYPKSIDLNYNVKPSYSSFVGRSLKYNFTSGRSLSTNYLWSMYQNKLEDRILTPAHLMLAPLDSTGSINFLNFKNVGVNTLAESSSFAKIRNATKVYNSNLVYTPSTFTSRYTHIAGMYLNESSQLVSSSLGVKKQHTLASTRATGNSFNSTILEKRSFDKFLSTNLNIDPSRASSNRLTNDSLSTPLDSHKHSEFSSVANIARLSQLLFTANMRENNFLFLRLSQYPTFISNINDDSDKSGLSYLQTKTSSVLPSYQSASIQTNSQLLEQYLGSASTTSFTLPYFTLVTNNNSTSSKSFSLNGPNTKVLLGEQSVRHYSDISPNKSHFNISHRPNSFATNIINDTANQAMSNLFSSTLNSEIGYIDKPGTHLLTSNRTYSVDSLPPVHSSLPNANKLLDYDAAQITTTTLNYDENGNVQNFNLMAKSAVSEVLEGSREKTPRAINTVYWSTFWGSSSPISRFTLAQSANNERALFFLPVFTNYADYDFRNEQAIDILEELFWETSYSSYNFDDYLTIRKLSNQSLPVSPKEHTLDSYFHKDSVGSTFSRALPSATLGEQPYSTGIQMEDYVSPANQISLSDFAIFPLIADLSETEDSFINFNTTRLFLEKAALNIIGTSNDSLTSRSYISTFNFFRSDFTDFNWFVETPNTPSFKFFMDDTASLNNLVQSATPIGSNVRLSNPATLRSSVRNSIVNYNAFQKVFKPRLDESRAHVNSSYFADLGQRQPFLFDTKVPYLQLLGKNRDSYFSTPLYYLKSHVNFNVSASLIDSLNTPSYDFPFLLSRTSDTARFTWIDWFAKWRYIEVQPSSVSRYSTLGVPYLRKPFDFNSTTGDKFQETELYFTRVSRSRRNYLTNWSYSPYMYNRSYLWNNLASRNTILYANFSNLPSLYSSCLEMAWYWKSPAHFTNTTQLVSYSSSGNDVYGKSTWRPTSSVQRYYYNVAKLVDVLSRREYLYRRTLENSYLVVDLPNTLCATPANPILSELKASFLFNDPATFSSEFSRDSLFSSNTFYKSLLLKSAFATITRVVDAAPVNSNLINNFILFYFFNSNATDIGNNNELFKSQFRPLKKGISSMLRLHATGAVAMPIELRLQVLASSRDVIHSWAIPSASVKIDCVPGYTSHRMMKFLLTGVYWGQCQEICGRYHHWMPIVVYFMKRDLFFLWCTHFVFNPTPNEVWDIADRRFSSLLRTASYDRSLWLSEFGVKS